MASETLTVFGVAVALAGGLLVVRSATLLVGRGRPRRGPTPAFILAGPYLRSRNPLYGGGVLVLAGLALAMRSPWLALLALATAITAHAWVVRVEEPRLRVRFGEAYAAYLAAVPRWLPSRRRHAADRSTRPA
jgi:protein-S-isoprenylcysteine O-methyltransferase Ste14